MSRHTVRFGQWGTRPEPQNTLEANGIAQTLFQEISILLDPRGKNVMGSIPDTGKRDKLDAWWGSLTHPGGLDRLRRQDPDSARLRCVNLLHIVRQIKGEEFTKDRLLHILQTYRREEEKRIAAARAERKRKKEESDQESDYEGIGADGTPIGPHNEGLTTGSIYD